MMLSLNKENFSNVRWLQTIPNGIDMYLDEAQIGRLNKTSWVILLLQTKKMTFTFSWKG